MLKPVGKIVGIDLLNKGKIIAEVDKSQLYTLDKEKACYPLIYSDNKGMPKAFFIKLLKNNDRWVFEIKLENDPTNLKSCLTHCIGKNISIKPMESIKLCEDGTIGSSISDEHLEKLIVI